MLDKSIESFLGLTDEEIQLRKEELIRKIPSEPGIDYLMARTRQFEEQP